MKFILILLSISFLSMQVMANLPNRIQCADPTSSIKLNSLQTSKVGVDEQLQSWNLDLQIINKNILKIVEDCPMCRTEIFSAKVNLKRLDGKALSAPLATPQTDGSIEALLICFQDLSTYP